MTFEQLLRILAARRTMAGLIFAATVLVTLILSLVLPKTYTATATVVADFKPDPVSGLSQAGTTTQGAYIATQSDIIHSPNVSRRVIRALRLHEAQTMRDKWQEDTEGKGDFIAWLGERINRGLVVKPARDSSVLEITYKGADPSFTAMLANAYAKSYIDAVIEMKVGPARSYADFFEERARLARDKLEKAQQRLTEAQRDKGILVTEERLDVENTRLNELGAQLVLSRAQTADSSSRNRAAKKTGDTLADVLNNPLLTGLKADLSRQQSKLEEYRARYGENHPLIVEARASVEDLEARIRSESTKIRGSVAVNDTIAQNREGAVQAAFDEQRAKLMRLKEQRGELSVLEQEVMSAQKLYDTLQARLSQINLESSSSQSNIYLLSPATESSGPSSPKVLLNTLISIVPATMLALVAVLLAEALDRRVRGVDDITKLLELPVIGTLQAPHRHTSKRIGFKMGWGRQKSEKNTLSLDAHSGTAGLQHTGENL